MSELHDIPINYPTFNAAKSMQHMAEVLRLAGFDFQPLPDEDLVCGYVFRFPDDQMIESGQFLLVPDESRLIFYLNMRGQIEANYFSEVIEYITRANNGMPTGNFEADYDLRRVRYKVGVDFGGLDMPAHIYRQFVLSALDIVSVYIHGLTDVRAGHISAKEAIAKTRIDALLME
jgi:hypothetical protein